MKSKNILFIAYFTSKGGGEIYLEQLIREISSKSNLYVMTNDLAGKDSIKTPKGIKYMNVRYGKILSIRFVLYNIIFILKLVRLLVKQKINVIQVNDNYSLALAFLPSKVLKIPIVFVNHYHYPPKYSIFKHIYNRIEMIICVSNWNKTNLILFTKKRKNIRVVPIGFRFNTERQDVERQYIAICTRYVKEKRIEDFIKIVDRLISNPKNYSLKYQIIGGSSYDKDYQAIKASIPEYIERIEFTNDVDYYYARTKLYVNTSEIESFGMTIIEAMGQGIPIVSTNLPTIEEFITPGQNGYLFETGDIEKASEMIERILNDVELYQAMRRANIRESSKYSIHVIGRKYMEIYEKI